MAAAGKCTSTIRQNVYIYKIPFSVTREICLSLDIDKAWEKLASEIGYTLQDVKLFDMAYMQPNGSPTKELLTDWGSRNPTASDLYFKLQKIQRRREMQILEAWFSSTSSNSDCNQIPLPKRDNLCDSQSHDLSDIDVRNLPKPKRPGKNSTGSSLSSMTASTNASLTSLNENINFNKPEKGKSGSKVIDGKDMSYFVKKDSGSKKFDRHDMKQGQPEPSIHEEECHVSSLGEEKGDMARQPMDSNFYDKLKSHDGYSSLSKDGPCDVDVAVALMGTQSFTNKELNQATNGFSDQYKLGEGAFGVVYYGFIKNTRCAIKRLNGDREGNDDDSSCHAHLKSEIKALIRYRHENIVPLYGYALDGADICLVYQYMSNGSLEDRLHCRNNTQPLTWYQRLCILKGAACGLQYLHTLNEKPLIHGDIKSSNVLLDKYMEAKIGDLGLAQSITGGTLTGAKTHITKQEAHSKLYQCKAYFPPESSRGSKISIKGDAYSFGVVIYEACTGEKAYDEKREGSDACFLVDYIHDSLNKNLDKCVNLMDPKGDNCPEAVLKMVFGIGNQCTEKLKKNRPDMVKVFKDLEKVEYEYRQKCGIKTTEEMVPLPCGINGEGDSSFSSLSEHLSLTSNGYNTNSTLSANPASVVCNGTMETGSLRTMETDPGSIDDPTKFIASQEPEAVMLQKMYDEGLRYPPGTPDTAEINDFKNPLYFKSDPAKIREMQMHELKFKSKEPAESSATFKSIEKEYELNENGSKILPGNELKLESDSKKLQEIDKFDAENLTDKSDSYLNDVASNANENDSNEKNDNSAKIGVNEKVKPVCVRQASSAEENEKMKQKRDDLFAKFEEAVQQGGMEGYDDTDDYDDENFSFFGSDFETIKFENEFEEEDQDCVETVSDYSDSTSSVDEKNSLANLETNAGHQKIEVTSELSNCVHKMTVRDQKPCENARENSEPVVKESCSNESEICHIDYSVTSGHPPVEGEEVEAVYTEECENKMLVSQNLNLRDSGSFISDNLNNMAMYNKSSHCDWKFKKSEPSENNEQYV